MHTTFKRRVLVAILVFFTTIGITGCRKGYEFRDATILGYDMTLCGCCGGFLIQIDGETPPNNGQYFLAQNKPSEFGFDNNTVYPVYGKVVWVTDESQCAGKFIEVTAWVKR